MDHELEAECKDAEGTCPKCGAYFDMSDECWEIDPDGTQVHYCGVTA